MIEAEFSLPSKWAFQYEYVEFTYYSTARAI